MTEKRQATLNECLIYLGKLYKSIQACAEEEQAYFERMPDNIRNGKKGDRVETGIYAMAEGMSLLEDAADRLREAIL